MARQVKILLLAMQISFCARSYAWTEAETNEVGLALASVIALTPEDCELVDYGGNDDEPLDEPFPTFGSLFEESFPCAQDWTPEAKRAAFFHYLDTLPSLVTNGVFCGDEWYASSALGFCRAKGDSSTLPSALRVIAAVHMPKSCQNEAVGILGKWGQASESMNDCLSSVVTNGDCLTDHYARKNLYYDYCLKLGDAYDAGSTNLARSGAAVLYRGVRNHSGAYCIDALLLRLYPEYAASSNRLHVAMRALSTDPKDEWANGSFIAITNALLNAEQPLPVVEGL